MDEQEKEEALKAKLTGLKTSLENANSCILSALENLNNLDDFIDLINNWDKYKEAFKFNNVQ